MLPSAKPHIPALDGIRGLAILMVLAAHYGDLSHSSSHLLRVINEIKLSGWAGVDLFFTLSGFLITGIVWESRAAPLHRARNFYVRRALRLFPLYYGVWVLLTAYALATHQWQSAYWAYLLYLGNIAAIYAPQVGVFPVAHMWSLAVEEQFYLLLPLLIWKVHRMRTVLWTLALAAGFSILLKTVLTLLHVQGNFSYFLLPTHIEGLAFGSMLAIGHRTPTGSNFCRRAAKYLPLVLILIAVELLYFHGLNNQDNVVLLCTITLFAIAATLFLEKTLHFGSSCQRAMSTSFLRFFGRYSYGLYIYHYLFRNVLKNVLYFRLTNRVPNTTFAGLLYFACCLLLLTAFSVASFHLYELPFLRLKARFAEPSVPSLENSGTAGRAAAV